MGSIFFLELGNSAGQLYVNAAVRGETMSDYVAIGICAVVLAGVMWQPIQQRKVRRHQKPCRPYLGEFIPPETPTQKEDRERWAKLRELIANN